MQDGIHPKYHPVVFVDIGAEFEFVSRSTMTSKETREIDGVEHYVIRLDISSASHPFYTGKQRFVDTAGRIDKFRSKYGSNYGRKKKKAAAEPAPAAVEAPVKEPASDDASE